MSLKRPSSQTTDVSLFPFLAVLLCTMGALILVLIGLTSHARLTAAKTAAAQAAAHMGAEYDAARKAAEDLEFYQWRIGEWQTANNALRRELSEERLNLAHLENHTRKLKDRVHELTEEAARDDARPITSQIEEEKNKLTLLQEEISQLRARDRQKPDDTAKPSKNYAVIPYQGPNGTDRFPIYLECTKEAVILQPEGIRLTEEDFLVLKGPSNPLAAAIRAAQNYIISRRLAGDNQIGEPYPLLLVRPDGLGSYYASMAALKTSMLEFGYELIDQDWKLTFQEPDPALAELQAKAIAEARERVRTVISSAPSHVQNLNKFSFDSFASSGLGKGTRSKTGLRGGRGSSYGDSRFAEASDSAAGDADGTSHESPHGGTGGGRLTSSPGGNAGRGSVGRDSHESDTAGRGDHATGDDELGSDGLGSDSLGTEGSGKGNHGSKTRGVLTDSKTSAGDSGHTYGASGDGEGTDSRELAKGALGEKNLLAQKQPGNRYEKERSKSKPNGTSHGATGENGSFGESGSSGGGSPGGEGSAGAPAGNVSFQGSSSGKSQVTPLAQQRGANWGLPEAGRSSIPVRRPIRIVCKPDRLIIHAESTRNKKGKEVAISFSDDTEESIDELISVLWDHMETWGRAGDGMYWRPILNVEVAQGAQARYEELHSLLQNSGVEIKEKKAAALPGAALPSKSRSNNREKPFAHSDNPYLSN